MTKTTFLLKTIFFSIAIFLITSCSSANNRLEVDSNISNKDTESILRIVNKRLLIAPLVAKSKWNTKFPIDDPIREKIILDSVQVKAKKLGVDETFARDFFQAQFDAGKIAQRQLHKKWTMQHQGLFDPAPNLATEVRPVLDNITPQLLTELKNIQPKLCNKQFTSAFNAEARKIIDSSFDDEVVKTAVSPILNHCKK